MPIFMIIALDIVIPLRFSINCSAVICSPTVLFAILWEASSETYAPRVYFPWYKFPIYYFAIFYFPFHKPKMPKILLYRLSISIRSHFANNCEWIDNPFIALGASWCLFVLVFSDLCIVSYWIDTLVLNSRGKYLLYFGASPFPCSREKPTQAQEVAGRISGAVAGEIYTKPRHTKYPS